MEPSRAESVRLNGWSAEKVILGDVIWLKIASEPADCRRQQASRARPQTDGLNSECAAGAGGVTVVVSRPGGPELALAVAELSRRRGVR